MSNVNIDKKVAKYEIFINDVLKEDLRIIHLKLDKVNTEVSDLIQQKHALRVITDKSIHPDGFKSQVNLGCNFFMEAAVTDTSLMLINIGLDTYLEFNLEEANKYLDARIKVFEHSSQELLNKAAETKAHIKLMLFGINELQEKSPR